VVFIVSFDESAVEEGGAGADERDEMGAFMARWCTSCGWCRPS
jgi:hypothetical protein